MKLPGVPKQNTNSPPTLVSQCGGKQASKPSLYSGAGLGNQIHQIIRNKRHFTGLVAINAADRVKNPKLISTEEETNNNKHHQRRFHYNWVCCILRLNQANF